MARNSEGPKCPTPQEVDQFIDFCNEAISLHEQNPTEGSTQICTHYERLIEILDWAGEQVSKRRLYSKKFQLKDKERTRLLKERLGEQYDDIVSDAKRLAEAGLFEVVASEVPDREDS